MILLVERTIEVSLILLLALGLMPLLRNRSAAVRHWVLSAAIVCAAIAPVVGLVVPSWNLPGRLTSAARELVPERASRGVETTVAVGRGSVGEADRRDHRARAPVEEDLVSFGAAVYWVWLAGAGLGITVLLIGLGRLASLASGARRITEGVWVARADEISRHYRFRRPAVLMESRHPTLLVAWGFLQPKVLLPIAAREWGENRVGLVLSHELAHVARGDWIVQLAAELVRAAYWFNPLVWMACTRLRQESEQACDDAVLNRGVEGSEYATHLVEIARDLQQGRTWMPAPAITRSSGFERRIKAMLDTGLDRRPVSRTVSVATLAALLAITIPIAGFAAAQTAFATLAGSIVDPMNGLLPGVTVVLTNVQSEAKYEVRTGHTGRYEFVGLPPGDYLLEARLPGFAVLQVRLTLTGQNAQQDLRLQIGSLEETVTVLAGGKASAPSPPDLEERLRELNRELNRLRRAAATCPGTPGGDSTRIGGNLRAPMKIKDARPSYPEHLSSAGFEGTVVLQGRIGGDGILSELDVVSSPHADFGTAALEAVRQWQWDSTLLNCVPMEVAIKVTVNFRHAP